MWDSVLSFNLVTVSLDSYPMTKDQLVDDIIRTHVLWAIGGGLIPIPIVDLVAVTGVQVDMIRQIAKAYDQSLTDSQAKVWISALSGSLVARFGAGAIKLIPGVGSIIGGVSMSIMSGATTYALGQVLRRHFDDGGSAYDFNADNFKDYFQDQFNKGKTYAEKLKKDKDKSEKNSYASGEESNDPVAKLQELAELRKQGILSEEEFQQLKQKLLQDF